MNNEPQPANDVSMAERVWLTVGEAAKRVHRSSATIRRWIREDHLTRFGERVIEEQLLHVDRDMRANTGGRPGKNITE